MHWDRFDICEAWYVYAVNYHEGQGSKIHGILDRLTDMDFTPPGGLDYDTLSYNGRAICDKLVKEQKYSSAAANQSRYDFITYEMMDDELESIVHEMTAAEILAVPGVRSIMMEEHNNEVLDRLLKQKELKEG